MLNLDALYFAIGFIAFGSLTHILFLSIRPSPIVDGNKMTSYHKTYWLIKCELCDTIGYQEKDYFHGFALPKLYATLWLCDHHSKTKSG